MFQYFEVRDLFSSEPLLKIDRSATCKYPYYLYPWYKLAIFSKLVWYTINSFLSLGLGYPPLLITFTSYLVLNTVFFMCCVILTSNVTPWYFRAFFAVISEPFTKIDRFLVVILTTRRIITIFIDSSFRFLFSIHLQIADMDSFNTSSSSLELLPLASTDK